MNDQLRMRLGAVTLALLTLAAVIFAVLNFQQRSRFILPDDGVTWMDSPQGVVAWHVVSGAPADRAGIKQGDTVQTVRGVAIHRATDVTKVLYRAGPWMELRYGILRDGESFEVPLVTAPQENPTSLENYLRVTALLYLFIGLFIFVRRWNAPRAIHFYLFCLVSFIFYSFHYSGKLNSFDWTIYWGNVVALLLQPALLVHFALVFPERRGTLWPKLVATYAPPAALLTLHAFIASGTLDFLPAFSTRYFLDKVEQADLGIYFLVAAVIFLFSYRRAPSGILRQQLKWVTGGTFAGILPFLLFYLLPYVFGVVPKPWMNISVYSLALIPLCFGYAIIRYRLMDVDIIFKRGLAYNSPPPASLRSTSRRSRSLVSFRTAPCRRAPSERWSPSSSPHFFFSLCATGCRRASTTSFIAIASTIAAHSSSSAARSRMKSALILSSAPCSTGFPRRCSSIASPFSSRIRIIPAGSCCPARWDSAPKAPSI